MSGNEDDKSIDPKYIYNVNKPERSKPLDNVDPFQYDLSPEQKRQLQVLGITLKLSDVRNDLNVLNAFGLNDGDKVRILEALGSIATSLGATLVTLETNETGSGIPETPELFSLKFNPELNLDLNPKVLPLRGNLGFTPIPEMDFGQFDLSGLTKNPGQDAPTEDSSGLGSLINPKLNESEFYNKIPNELIIPRNPKGKNIIPKK